MKACLLPKMSIFNLRGRGEEKEKMAGGGGGRLFEGGVYFKYFDRRGDDYSREAINRGTVIIRGNTVPKLNLK